VLRRARLVEVEKSGRHVTYRLAGEDVCQFFLALRRLAESRLAEVGRVAREYFEARDSMEPVDIDVLRERVLAGDVTLLDVRPASEYDAGHIPGALSVPLADIESRLSELPRDRTIVAYCRGPYCVLSQEAVERLGAHGFQVLRLADGVADWKSRGLSIATAVGQL
jgi:ArsR family transcriptional regulator